MNMHEVSPREPDGKISVLGYDDFWGEREYLYTMTDLCDRAGCHCINDRLVCSNLWGVLFVPAFHHWYYDRCMESCECFEEDLNSQASEISSDVSSSLESANSNHIDWAAENAEKMSEVYNSHSNHDASRNGREIEDSAPPASRLPQNRLTGGKQCLAGQAAGWTSDNFANGHCCPGYSFREMSASEAYVNYGLPIGNIVAGIWVVGMCLKGKSG